MQKFYVVYFFILMFQVTISLLTLYQCVQVNRAFEAFFIGLSMNPMNCKEIP